MGADIWSAAPLETAWHQAIADIWTHHAFCSVCTEDHARCPEGVALREAEQAAWRAARTEMYVPLALGAAS